MWLTTKIRSLRPQQVYVVIMTVVDADAVASPVGGSAMLNDFSEESRGDYVGR